MPLDPFTLSLIAGGLKAAVPGIIGGIGQYGAAQDLKLSPSQRKRLLELERLQARNALGMTADERELYRTQAMTPVQAAEREAMARMGASQQIGDIGQGAAFRQQQALLDTGKAARGQVSQAVAERDAQVAQQQAEEIARLQEQQQRVKIMERQAVLSALGGIAEGGLGAVELGAEKAAAKKEYEETLEKMEGAGKVVAESTRGILGIGSSAGSSIGSSVGKAAVENTRATNASLGGDGNRAVENMVSNDELERLIQMMLTQGY
jgi:hypothetical protein